LSTLATDVRLCSDGWDLETCMAPILDGLVSHMNETTYAEWKCHHQRDRMVRAKKAKPRLAMCKRVKD